MTDTERAAVSANIAKMARLVGTEKTDTIVGMIKPRFVKCDLDPMCVTIGFPVLAWEMNPNGVVHGGVVCTMFDTAMGIAAYIISGGITPTMSLTTSFLRPAPCTGMLLVRAHITKAGRSVIYASAEMYEEGAEDTLIATAQAVFHR